MELTTYVTDLANDPTVRAVAGDVAVLLVSLLTAWKTARRLGRMLFGATDQQAALYQALRHRLKDRGLDWRIMDDGDLALFDSDGHKVQEHCKGCDLIYLGALPSDRIDDRLTSGQLWLLGWHAAVVRRRLARRDKAERAFIAEMEMQDAIVKARQAL